MGTSNPFRHVITLGGVEFVLARPTVRGLFRLHGKLPVLPVDEKAGGPEASAADERKASDLLRREYQFIAAFVKSPRLVVDESDDPDAIPIDELPDDVFAGLQAELKRLAGWTKEAADDLRPLSETAAHSSGSTGSPSDSAEAPPITSETTT